jgi:hypothetical protein
MEVVAPPKPPSRAELEALIKEARGRQLRRRLLGAAGVAVAAAIALGIYALTAGNSNRNTGPAPIGPGGVPLCRTSQISVSLPGLSGLIEQGRTGLFVMRNTSRFACSLPLRPPTATITRHGARLPVHQVGGRGIVLASWQPLRVSHLLKPGGQAAISSYWQNWCGSHSYRPMFTEHFRFDTQLVVSFPIGPHPFCSDRAGPSTIRVSRPLIVRR